MRPGAFGSLFLAGVYNGLNYSTPSHRADIPRTTGLTLGCPQKGICTALGAAIDFRRAIYFNRTLIDAPGCANTIIEQATYAHRVHRELLVLEISATGAGPSWAGCDALVDWPLDPAATNDLALRSLGNISGASIWAGNTVLPEEPELPVRSVAVVFDMWASDASESHTLRLTPTEPQLLLRTVARSDLDVGASDVASVASAALDTWATYERIPPTQLRAEHEAAWAALWASGGIELQGNTTLAAAVNASLYDILCSVRSDWSWASLTPGGLGTNGYDGHSFWDAETWIEPPLDMLFPDLAAGVTAYRLARLDAAVSRAQLNGFEGAFWPWESAFSGHDVSGDRRNDLYEQHIGADIALATRKLYYATRNESYLAAVWPLLNATCTFWACRFTRSDTRAFNTTAQACSPKDGTGNFTIRGLVPPGRIPCFTARPPIRPCGASSPESPSAHAFVP